MLGDYVPPTEWEGGPIAFGVDPVGVGVGVGAAFLIFCTLSPEPMGGFWPNFHKHIIESEERSD